jgi:hypothetical protein
VLALASRRGLDAVGDTPCGRRGGREGQHETTDSGRVKVTVDKLGAFGEPMALAWPRGRVEKMLPKINVPDLLFEVHLDRVPAFPAPVRP